MTSSFVFGKRTEEARYKIDCATDEKTRQKAAKLGMSVNEYRHQRELIDVWGLDHVARLHRDRLTLVAGEGQDEGE